VDGNEVPECGISETIAVLYQEPGGGKRLWQGDREPRSGSIAVTGIQCPDLDDPIKRSSVQG
jgi:hypothetical protein